MRPRSDDCNFRQNFAKCNVDLPRILLENSKYFYFEHRSTQFSYIWLFRIKWEENVFPRSAIDLGFPHAFPDGNRYIYGDV